LDKAGPGRPATGKKRVEGRGDYPSADKTYALAYTILGKLFPDVAGDYMYSDEESPKPWGGRYNQILERMHDDLDGGMDVQAVWNKYGGEGKYSSDSGSGDVENAMGVQKMGKDVPSAMAHEWERAVNSHEKKRLQEEMLRRLLGKGHKRTRKSDDDLFFRLFGGNGDAL